MSTVVGKRIARARDKKGWSQTDLAKAAGVHQGTVSKWERGRELPDDPRPLAKVLGLPLQAFSAPPTDEKPAEVAEIDVEVSAGTGGLIEREDVAGMWVMPEAWLREQSGAAPGSLKIITIRGDSGISDPPRIDDLFPGDKVLVDISDRRPSPPGYFVVDDGTGLLAKRVEVVGQKIRMTSNNRIYAVTELRPEDARIVGRIKGKWCRL